MKLFRKNAGQRAIEDGRRALAAYLTGDYDEALALAQSAVDQAEGLSNDRFPGVQSLCLGAKTMALAAQGNYEEARSTAETMRRLGDLSASALQSTTFAEFYTGQLNEALKICNEVVALDPSGKLGRVPGAQLALLLGDVAYALKLLDYEDEDVVRYLAIAEAHVQGRNAAGAARALEKAAEIPIDNPLIIFELLKLRTLSHACAGNETEARSWLARFEETAARVPHKRWEAGMARGETALLLGSSDEAVAMFTEAGQAARHPIERHITNYWLATAHQAGGDRQGAERLYAMVAADDFPTWMGREAAQSRTATKAP